MNILFLTSSTSNRPCITKSNTFGELKIAFEIGKIIIKLIQKEQIGKRKGKANKKKMAENSLESQRYAPLHI